MRAESSFAVAFPKVDAIVSSEISAAKKSWLLRRAWAIRCRKESNIEEGLLARL
jgi:hypothetical protein